MKTPSAEMSPEFAAKENKSLSIAPYFPHYQPLIYLPNRRIAGYEMLARRRDDKGHVVSAGAMFGDLSLPAEYRIEVDRHLRRQGFARFSHDAGAGFITVNISPDWINRLGDKIASPTLCMIDEAGLDPRRVIIEITETAGELDRLQRLVRQYHAGGLRVAIDDFGAGNSQIDRIIALAPDMIKLDMRLFKMAAQGGLSADVLLGMMAIAERAGCEVVCEGVESIEEFCFGIECGAHYMQGFLFAPGLQAPLAADHFTPQVDALIQQYFGRKCERLSHTIDHSRALKHAVLGLQRELQGNSAPETITRAPLRTLGIMRFFICDTNGRQLSPNYEVGRDSISLDHRYVGYNWSWRPYFPTLTAMKARADFDLVASTTYRDASTSLLCKTFGLFLDEKRVLLVDAEVSDEVLYANTASPDKMS